MGGACRCVISVRHGLGGLLEIQLEIQKDPVGDPESVFSPSFSMDPVVITPSLHVSILLHRLSWMACSTRSTGLLMESLLTIVAVFDSSSWQRNRLVGEPFWQCLKTGICRSDDDEEMEYVATRAADRRPSDLSSRPTRPTKRLRKVQR